MNKEDKLNSKVLSLIFNKNEVDLKNAGIYKEFNQDIYIDEDKNIEEIEEEIKIYNKIRLDLLLNNNKEYKGFKYYDFYIEDLEKYDYSSNFSKIRIVFVLKEVLFNG